MRKKRINRLNTYTTTKTNNQEIKDEIDYLNNYLKDYRVSVGYINLKAWKEGR